MFSSTKLLTCVVLTLTLARASAADEPVVIAAGGPPNQPKQPQVVVDEKGVVHVAFGINNAVLYCRSEDAGRSFTSPVEMPGHFVLSLGMRRGPRIAATGDSLCISAIGGKQGKGRDGDVLAYHSSDCGMTWQGPAQVNDSSDSAREGLHAMAGSSRDQMCCVWLDLRNGKSEIYAATSADGGKTWGKNTRVYQSPDGSVCECCHPSVAYDASGKLHIMWRNSLGGSRDMYLASSSDGGTTFGRASKLGSGTWRLDACPMDGGYLVISPKGTIFTAWRRDSEVFMATPNSKEQRVGIGRQPWIAATARGAYVLWLEDRTGRLLMQMPGTDGSTELAAKANDPVIASAPTGVGPVVAAWEERRGKDTALVCQVVEKAK